MREININLIDNLFFAFEKTYNISIHPLYQDFWDNVILYNEFRGRFITGNIKYYHWESIKAYQFWWEIDNTFHTAYYYYNSPSSDAKWWYYPTDKASFISPVI